MSLILFFTVDGPPVPAARARVVRQLGHRPRAFTPEKTAAYEQRVGLFTMRAMAAAGWPRDGKGPFGIRLDIFRAKDVADWDNLGKSICDGMSKAHIWSNDKYIHDARVRMFIDKARPRTEISVWRLDDLRVAT